MSCKNTAHSKYWCTVSFAGLLVSLSLLCTIGYNSQDRMVIEEDLELYGEYIAPETELLPEEDEDGDDDE